MVAISENLIGLGLYTTAEAATYSRVSTGLLSRWLFGNKQGERVITPQLPDPQEKLVTFLDFVQALAIRVVRLEYRIPLPTIREAVDRASARYNLDYIFAREHTTYLYGKEIFICLPGEEDLTQVTGKLADQRAMKKIVELYLKDLGFGSDGLANKYCAFRWKDLQITMDPKQRFGEPLLPCGHTARTMWEASKAEGGIEAAAKVYGVLVDEVELAYRYFDHLEGKPAA